MASVIDLILEMIFLIIRNTVTTLLSVAGILGDLLASLGFVSSAGPVPFIVSVLILGGILFFLGKFFIGSIKTLVLLFIAGFIILAVLFASV